MTKDNPPDARELSDGERILGLVLFFVPFIVGIVVLLIWHPIPWLVFIIVFVWWICVLGFIGHWITKKWFGVLVGPRKTASLSSLQFALWFSLVVAAFAMVAGSRLSHQWMPGATSAETDCQVTLGDDQSAVGDSDACSFDALAITLPDELLLAIGISGTSFIGSAVIKSVKRAKRVDTESIDGQLAESAGKIESEESDLEMTESDIAKIESTLGQSSGFSPLTLSNDIEVTTAEMAKKRKARLENLVKELEADIKANKSAKSGLKRKREKLTDRADGVLFVNTSVADARLSDLFRGDEVGNREVVDMSKVQMFFFSVVAVVAYSVAVCSAMNDTEILLRPNGVLLPPFSDTLNALLAISHAAFLSSKTIDHTKVAS